MLIVKTSMSQYKNQEIQYADSDRPIIAIDSLTLVSFSETIRPVILKTGVKNAASVQRGKKFERMYSMKGSELNSADLFGTVIMEMDEFSPTLGHDCRIVFATQFWTTAYPDVMYL